MYKLFKQENADTKDSSVVSEITNIVAKDFNFEEPSAFKKIIIQMWFIALEYVLMLIFLIVGAIMIIQAGLGVAVIFFLLMVVDVVFLFLSHITRAKLKAALSAQMVGKQDLIYQTWFDEVYEDIKVDGSINSSRIESLARTYRGAGIPGDARIVSFAPGYRMKGKNGALVEAAVINWRWTRSNGKQTVTYYRKRVYLTVNGYKDSFNDFQFSMAKNGIFNKNRKELENEAFNKAWIYNHNDPVKLRMLFTPSVQEDVLNVITNKTFEMNRVGDVFLISEEVPLSDTTFIMNTRGTIDFSSKDAIVRNYVTDVLADIQTFQVWLLNISVFRTLFKTI